MRYSPTQETNVSCLDPLMPCSVQPLQKPVSLTELCQGCICLISGCVMKGRLLRREMNTEHLFFVMYCLCGPGENLQHRRPVLQRGRVQSQQPLHYMPTGLVQTHVVHSREYVLKHVGVPHLFCLIHLFIFNCRKRV